MLIVKQKPTRYSITKNRFIREKERIKIPNGAAVVSLVEVSAWIKMEEGLNRGEEDVKGRSRYNHRALL